MSFDDPLYEAIAKGDLDGIEAAVAAGADLKKRMVPWGSPLAFAVTADRPDAVRKLLELGANVNGVPGEESPLYGAILRKSETLVRLLLEHGADTKVRDQNGSSPLITATALDSIALTKLLLDAGADPLAKNKHGLDAITTAKMGRKPKILALLTEAATASARSSAVSFVDAARFGQADRVRELVAAANAAEREEALVQAIAGGHVDCVRELLEHADVNAPIRAKEQPRHAPQPPLLHAITASKAEVVKLLLERGADANAKLAGPHSFGMSALLLAATQKDPAIVRSLLDAGADVQHRDTHGRSALALARQCGFKRVIKLLEPVVRAGAALLTLHEAATDGQAARVRELVASGADVNAADERGLRPLGIAVAQGHAEVVRALLGAGANARLEGPEAARLWQQALGPKASGDIVRALLDAGLDPNAQISEEGMRPLMYAAGFGGDDVVAILEALLAAGADPDARFQPRAPKELAALSALLPKRRQPEAMTAMDFARQVASRKAREFFAKRAGEPPDAYEALRARLSAWKESPDAVEPVARDIARRLGARRMPWKRRKGVYLLSASPDAVARDFDELAALARSRGSLLVQHSQAASSGDRTGLLLFPTTEPLEVLAACGTNGDNYGLGTREVVAWFEETRARWPFELVGCGFDFVDVAFTLPVAEPGELLRRIFEFCPDAQEDDEAKAAVELAKDGRCFFWWD